MKFEVKKILNILKNGGVVAAPTDTVYGLLVDVSNPSAIKKIFAIKGRGEGKALPIFLASLDWLSRFVDVTPEQRQFLQQVWPGKVTVILPLKPGVTLINNAFRIPAYPLVIDILNAFGKPLTGTSANKSGTSPCLSAQEVRKQLISPAPDYIIDKGTLAPSQPSTIVDVTTSPFRIIREGADNDKVKTLLKD